MQFLQLGLEIILLLPLLPDRRRIILLLALLLVVHHGIVDGVLEDMVHRLLLGLIKFTLLATVHRGSL